MFLGKGLHSYNIYFYMLYRYKKIFLPAGL